MEAMTMFRNSPVRCEFCGAQIQGGRYCPWPSSCEPMGARAEREEMARARCSACQGPAEYRRELDFRCSRCAPDNCSICWVWGKGACGIHRLAAPANTNSRRWRRELKIICGEHKAFVDPCGGEHPMHGGGLGPQRRTDDEPTLVELPVVRTGRKEVA